MTTTPRKKQKKPKAVVLFNAYEDLERSREEPGESGVRLRLANEIATALTDSGFSSAVINIEDDVQRVFDAFVVEQPDVIFNMVEQFEGETTHVSAVTALLDLLGATYTGSEPLCQATCQDRARTRLLISDAGIPTPSFALVRDVNAIPITDHMRFPLIVTQAFDDIYDSEGTESPLLSRDGVEARVRGFVSEFDMPLIIEEFIDDRCCHAIVLGDRTLEVLPIIETLEDGTYAIAQLAQEQVDQIRQLSQRVFRIAGCRDAAQVDFRLDEELGVYVSDVRPFVDFDQKSLFRLAVEHTERSFGETVSAIGNFALLRARAMARLESEQEPTEGANVAGEPGPEALPDDDADTEETLAGSALLQDGRDVLASSGESIEGGL